MKTINYSQQAPAILLVEDSPTQRLLISNMIKEMGYPVLHAEDGVMALHLAKQCQPALIIMDLDMPIMNGMEAAKKMWRNPSTAHIPIVILSACESQGCRLRALMRGVTDYLVKPPSAEDLHNIIATYATHHGNSVAPSTGVSSGYNRRKTDGYRRRETD